MSKFTKIIQNVLGQLNETNADGTTAAGPYNGGVSTTAKDTASSTETKPSGISDPNNPLHSAFEKIKQNPENPSLSDNEHEALQGLAKTLDTAKNNTEEETPEEKEQANTSGGQVQNTVVSGSETYKSSTPGITG